MKKFRSYFILILATALITSCSGLNKMKKNASLVKYEVNPPVLVTHAGVVEVTVKGSFPAKYFDKSTVLEVTPVLVYAGGETAYDKVTLQGEKVQSNNKLISYTGGNFSYTGKINYKDAMRKSELMIRVKATRKTTVLDFDPVKIADGVIATSTLVVNSHSRPVMSTDKYVQINPEQKVADIYYAINKADISSTELKAEDLQLLKEYIKLVNSTENKQFTGTSISSYASPDGAYDFNEKLAVKRGTTADGYIKKEFKDAKGVTAPTFFTEKTTAEDWDGFKTEVEKSTIQDKDLILRVLSMYSDPAVREKEIKNMSSAFEVLKTDILPKLRRSMMTVNVNNVGRTDEQILAQMRTDPKVLSIEEMLRAGSLSKDANEQLKFYQTAAETFPRDFRAANNVGYTYIQLGKPAEAGAAFEKAAAIENNDVVKSNRGFVALMSGDLAKAEEYFTSMTSATAESKFGLGLIATNRGQYDQAVNFFGTEPSYDLALALVLKGDVNKAKVVLDGLKPNTTRGNPSYLKAVVGARLDDKTYMIDNLRQAISIESKWKAYAKDDLEFAKYFADDTFKSIVQ
jgi:tetratricopeptide (TPR) repeat protein